MAKHSLLPEIYKDSATHTAIIFALKPFENKAISDANNPALKWNLYKAWDKAEELLEHSRWLFDDSSAFDPQTMEYVLSAYTDKERERNDGIIAGIVGYQMLNPQEGIAIRRIEFRKGGEINIVLSHPVAKSLQEKVAGMVLIGRLAEEAAKKKPSLMKRIVQCLKAVMK